MATIGHPGSTFVRRTTPQIVLILLVAGIATAWTVSQARSMGNMPGAMGMGLPAFVGMWTVMMSAMMLPSVAPIASTYSRMITSNRVRRLGMFTGGYLLVWSLSAIPAFGLAWAAGKFAGSGPTGIVIASGVFAIAGAYQLTPLKYRCLSACRSPVALIFQFASFRGPWRDVNAGLHSGYFCLGCCWSLMVLMAAFGVMNVYGMVALASVIAIEKLTPAGERFSKHTKPRFAGNRQVLVWVDDSTLAFELSHRYKPTILKRLKNEFGDEAVKDVRFLVGELR